MEERHVEEVRSDYNRENVYSVTHPDALATGDAQGKGTGYGGHTFSLPNCKISELPFKIISVFSSYIYIV